MTPAQGVWRLDIRHQDGSHTSLIVPTYWRASEIAEAHPDEKITLHHPDGRVNVWFPVPEIDGQATS